MKQKSHEYLPNSWESITTKIKEHFCIQSLTKEDSQRIMKLYLTGMNVEDMIKKLEKEGMK